MAGEPAAGGKRWILLREVDGALSVVNGAQPDDPSREQVLVEWAQGYQPYLAANGRSMAVDIAFMSDLQVTHLYRRGEDGLWSLVENLATRGWQLAEQRLDIKADQVLRPRTRFLGWSADGKSCELELTGDAASGEAVQLRVTLPLAQPSEQETL